MTANWITNVNGVHALVDDEDQRAVWTRVRGWRDAAEPRPADLVYIAHPEVGCGGPVPFEALASGWSVLGWMAGPPPEPIDLTREQVTAQAAVDSGSHLRNNTPATGGDDDESEE